VSLLRAEPEIAEGYRRRFRHIWVDEYQDVDEVQYALLRLLCPPTGNICAIGDPDQAIYAFRGSDVGFFLRFQEDFPQARTVTLTRNYRSTATIVAASSAAVAPTSLVPGRELRAVGSHGAPDLPVALVRAASEAQEAVVVADLVEEALGGTSFHALDTGVDPGATGRLSFSDVAVLYRTARQAAPVIDVLARRGLPFQCRSHDRLVQAPATARLLRTIRNQAETGSAARTVPGRLRAAATWLLDQLDAPTSIDAPTGTDEPPPEANGNGNGAERSGAAVTEADVRLAVDLLAPLAAMAGDDLDAFWTATAMDAEVDLLDPRAEAISLLTLHAAKGLEFGLVIMIGCDDGLLPMRWGSGSVDEAEERRLFFVGMTRARARLVLTGADRRRRAGEAAESRPSPFLADLPEHLVERRTGVRRAQLAHAGRQLRLL
jgi:superfamily I DNA/RNA helicase